MKLYRITAIHSEDAYSSEADQIIGQVGSITDVEPSTDLPGWTSCSFEGQDDGYFFYAIQLEAI